MIFHFKNIYCIYFLLFHWFSPAPVPTHPTLQSVVKLSPSYLRLDKPAHLVRFCNNFASPQILTQPSDFSRFWDTLATFLTTFFRILGHIRVLPPPFRQLRRGAATPLRALYHNVFAATALWLQTSTLQTLWKSGSYILCTGLLVDLLTRRHDIPILTCFYA